jgi:hypothetical protein
MYEMDSYGSGTGTFEKQHASAYSTAAIQGTFAFLLNGIGFDNPEQPPKQAHSLAIAGNMRPNGLGDVDGGEVDLVAKGSHQNDVVLQGASTYSIGSDGRGTATLQIAGTLSHFSVVAVSANKLLLSSSDDVTPVSSTLPLLLGTAEKQDANMSPGTISGPYVYYATADSFVQMGRLVTEPGDPGLITEGVLDERGRLASDGTMKLNQLVPLTGTYGYSPSGRAWFNLSRQESGTYTQQLIYAYPVSAEKFFFVTEGLAASTGAVSGEGYAQHGEPFDDSSVQGTYAFQSVIPMDLGTGWLDREPNSPLYSLADFQNQSGVPMSFQFYPPETDGIGRLDSGNANANFNWSTMRYYIVSPSKVLLMGLGPDGSYIGNDLIFAEKTTGP